MTYIHATIYGLIQGISEFLPVSSSGHLALLPKVMEFKDPGVAFDLAMHVGTAMAVIVYFWRDLLLLLDSLISKLKGDEENAVGAFYAINLIVATIATLVVALIFKDFAREYARNSTWIAINLMAFGLFMFVSDKFCAQKPSGEMNRKLSWKKALIIGLSQAIAIFPGVSRSGVTIGAARALKLGRVEAARFSFLLSLPIIIGGFIFEVDELTRSASVTMGHCLMGMFVSFAVGLATIHFFIRIISKIGLIYFVLYRFLIAGLVLYFL